MHNGTIGAVLCSLRKQNAMTQKDLSQKLSVHITTIKNWESGNCYPDAKNVCALADLFHVTTDFLLGRESSETISLEGLSPGARRQLLHIVQAYIDTIPCGTSIKEADESMQVDSSASFYLLVACLRLLETTLDLRARISGTVGSWHPRALALYAPKSA